MASQNCCSRLGPNLFISRCSLFPEDPWIEKPKTFQRARWVYPCNELDKLKADSFKELWEHGFFITNGEKFGADFLAYPGDPILFHAQFLVICWNKKIEDLYEASEAELVAKCRLGTAVKKNVILSFRNQDNKIMFKKLHWTGATA